MIVGQPNIQVEEFESGIVRIEYSGEIEMTVAEYRELESKIEILQQLVNPRFAFLKYR